MLHSFVGLIRRILLSSRCGRAYARLTALLGLVREWKHVITVINSTKNLMFKIRWRQLAKMQWIQLSFTNTRFDKTEQTWFWAWLALVCVDTDDAGPGLIPLDGKMLESGRGAFDMPSVEARGFAVVPVAHATLTSARTWPVKTLYSCEGLCEII